jgi:hypothetical protein
MAVYTVKPQNVLQVDDKAGNAYSIFSFEHTKSAGGSSVAVELDASVIKCVHIATATQTVVVVTLDTTADTTLWTKTASIPSDSATGTYTLVARHSGTAASVGGFKGDL